MATKPMNFKMDEGDVQDMKQVASVFHMTVTDLVKEAVREYIARLKEDPFYKLTVQVEEANSQESAEILDEINALSDDDLAIASSKRFTI